MVELDPEHQAVADEARERIAALIAAPILAMSNVKVKL